MCQLVREHQPAAAIVVGGHVANLAAFHGGSMPTGLSVARACAGFAQYLGEDPGQPIRHPLIPTRIGTRSMGITVSEKPSATAATLIPSVGCPVGCNFCSTSAMFGGKGKHVDFYRHGRRAVRCHVPDRTIACQEVVLRDGRELPPASPANATVARLDAEAREVLDTVRIQFRQRALVLRRRATRRPGHRVGLDGSGRRE